jgi:hypothetical protein
MERRVGAPGTAVDDMTMPRNVLIVGMARSGTSLTAAIFARAGYFVGAQSDRHIREGDDNNPFGYFEADDVVEANRRVLLAVGFTSRNTWNEDVISRDAIDAIAKLPPLPGEPERIERWNEHAPWLWKDPELCLTLSYWHRVLPSDTRVVVVTRDPEAIYRSFRRMGWSGRSEADRRQTFERIEQHVCGARRTLANCRLRHVEVEYADFGRRPARVARALSELCDLPIAAEDLNFHHDLNHSTGLRGRAAASLRIAGKHIPQRQRDLIERVVPRRVLTAFFPERRYGPPRTSR